MERYAGLDVHSKSSTYFVQDGSGNAIGRGAVPTTPEGLRQFRDQNALPPGTPIALESGTNSFFVVDVLLELGLAPVVIDAREVRAKASRPLQKSDRRDAQELCDGLRRGLYRCVVWVPPRETRLMRELQSRRRHFVRMKTREVNATKKLLRGSGNGSLSRPLQAVSGWEKLIASLPADSDLQDFVRYHQTLWLCAHEQVQKLEARLLPLTNNREEEMKRLMTVPGVGPIVASTFLAVVGDAGRFPDARHVASYAGLVPSTFQSGSRDRHGHITKRGSAELRSMLCEAAHHAKRIGSPLNPFFTKIKMRRGYRMAIVAVAHRICRMMYAILRDGSTFELARAGVEAGRFEKVSVRQYRQIPVTV